MRLANEYYTGTRGVMKARKKGLLKLYDRFFVYFVDVYVVVFCLCIVSIIIDYFEGGTWMKSRRPNKTSSKQ